MRPTMAGCLSLALCSLALSAPSAPGLAQPAATEAERPVQTAQSRRQDLQVFRDRFLARDRSYSPQARAEAERRLAALEARIDQIEQPAFELELARIVALADNGHSHYVLGSIARYYSRVPVRLGVFGEEFYVLRAIEEHADLLGARLVAIDGHSSTELRAEARQLWGGLPAFRDRFAFNLLESPDLLRAAGLVADPGAAVYRFVLPDGRTVERRLAGEPSSAARPFATPALTMFPQRLPMEDSRWRTALSPDKAPWSLRDAPIPFRWRSAPEVRALVFDIRHNLDGPGMKIEDALREFTDVIGRQKPVNLVIDMRINDGGDLRTTRAFMQSLPKLVPGRIFVLTSPLTFSAAISSVGYAKQAAPDRVSIVGEGVGDRLVFFAEGRGVDLPNNRGMIGLATQRHDYAGGCRAFKDCHTAVVRDPIAVPSLAPDMPAPWTIDAYLAGRDPAMEAIAQALR
jgi:hypothetical protein